MDKKPRRIGECPECVLHTVFMPNLVEACASVAIDSGRSSMDLMIEYMSEYHHAGHVLPDDLVVLVIRRPE
jgi:hypothetical protein